MPSLTRPYRQVARAAATVDARRRIIEAFLEKLADIPLDQITLDELAARAGSTRQTLIRYFGGKDGLLQAAAEQIGEDVHLRRSVGPGASIEDNIVALVRDYDAIGDVIVQLLAQETRLPSLHTFLDYGRRAHREWIARLFAPWLDALAAKQRARKLDQLYAATDVNTWKLFRRDFGHSAKSTADMMAEIARRLLDGSPQARD